jgi:virginiamycin B lyase
MTKLTTSLLLSALLSCCASAVWSQSAADFPDGPGKEVVVATCGGCHAIDRLRAGYTPAGWSMIVQMIQNMGAPVAPEDWVSPI